MSAFGLLVSSIQRNCWVLYLCVTGFEVLVSRVETSLSTAGTYRRRTRTYSSRNCHRRDMVRDPIQVLQPPSFAPFMNATSQWRLEEILER